MIISDSIPIQFWDIDEDTFNESQPICGLTPDCFCLPVNCSQEVPIQFTDTLERDYVLTLYNTDDEEIVELSFDREFIGDTWVYSLSFIPINVGICNAKVYSILGYNEADEITGSISDAIETVDGDIETTEILSREVFFLGDPEDCEGRDGPYTVYYLGAFTTGTIIYFDVFMTDPVTEHDYVADSFDTANVYELNSLTGEIGADTTFDCGSAFITGSITDVIESVVGAIETNPASREIFFHNDPEDCESRSGPFTVYFEGTFGPGVTIYFDEELTDPVTEQDYVADAYITCNVYEMDPLTGEILSDTGFDCCD